MQLGNVDFSAIERRVYATGQPPTLEEWQAMLEELDDVRGEAEREKQEHDATHSALKDEEKRTERLIRLLKKIGKTVDELAERQEQTLAALIKEIEDATT